MEPAWLQGLLVVMGQESCIFPGFTNITCGAEGSGKQQLGCSVGISGIINLESVKRCICGSRDWAASGDPAGYGQHFSC